MLKGAFGNLAAFDATLIKAIPLIFTALSFSLARRSIINLGRKVIHDGALAATAVGVATPNLPAIIHLPATLLAGFLEGACRTSHRCVKSQIRRVGAYHHDHAQLHCEELISFFVNGPLMDSASSSYPQSAPMEPSARLYKFIPGMNVHTGLYYRLGVHFPVLFLPLEDDGEL